jgi:TM2 domain-containing membrane protein YozV
MRKSKVQAALLCLLFGLLGIHRFYLGYPIIGLIQMFTLGGFLIWAMLDLFGIFSGVLRDKNDQPLE